MTTVQALVLVQGHEWDALYLTGGSSAFADQLERAGWLLEAIRGDRRCFVRRRSAGSAADGTAEGAPP